MDALSNCDVRANFDVTLGKNWCISHKITWSIISNRAKHSLNLWKWNVKRHCISFAQFKSFYPPPPYTPDACVHIFRKTFSVHLWNWMFVYFRHRMLWRNHCGKSSQFGTSLWRNICAKVIGNWESVEYKFSKMEFSLFREGPSLSTILWSPTEWPTFCKNSGHSVIFTEQTEFPFFRIPVLSNCQCERGCAGGGRHCPVYIPLFQNPRGAQTHEQASFLTFFDCEYENKPVQSWAKNTERVVYYTDYHRQFVLIHVLIEYSHTHVLASTDTRTHTCAHERSYMYSYVLTSYRGYRSTGTFTVVAQWHSVRTSANTQTKQPFSSVLWQQDQGGFRSNDSTFKFGTCFNFIKSTLTLPRAFVQEKLHKFWISILSQTGFLLFTIQVPKTSGVLELETQAALTDIEALKVEQSTQKRNEIYWGPAPTRLLTEVVRPK